MDYLLQGHPYVKSALDVAFWDILGKVHIATQNLLQVIRGPKFLWLK